MFSFRLPNTDLVLLLSPRWGELPPFAQAAILGLLVLVPVGLMFWLYRYELQLIRRTVALGLLTLRLLVLLFILFMVCLRPIVAREITEAIPGKVLIAVDRSASADVADPQRAPVDKLRLAQALHLADDICPEAVLDQWIKQYDAIGAPRWLGPDEKSNDPEGRRQLLQERRRQHDLVCQRVDALTRTQVAARVLDDRGVQLVKKIRDLGHQVELLAFSQETWDSPADDLPQLLRPRSDLRQGNNPEPGPHTDLRLPLLQALERSGPDRGQYRGVVVLTDGQHNWKETPLPKAAELGERSLPVYAIALGDREPPRDVAVAEVKAPSTVFKDVEADVEARIRVRNLPKQSLVVELKRADASGPSEKKLIKHDGTDRDYPIHFAVKLDKIGPQAMTVSVRPVDGEARTENNSRPVRITVADDKAKVLLIDGEARWEYHYLATALMRDPTLQLQRVVFEQPRLGLIGEDELKKIGTPARSLPTEPDAYEAYGCIILGDVSPEQLPPPERARLEKYVADRGGTLIILAGKRSMPLAYLDGDRNREVLTDPFLNLLPIAVAQVVQPRQGFGITLTQDGKETAFLRLEETAADAEQRWAELPRHFWGIAGWAKPGARPLAFLPDADPVAATAAIQGGKREPEKENALIVRQNYGFGRVLFVGLDSTWRWRFKVGDTFHHRFWGQLVRWAASDQPLVAGNAHVRFGTREAVYDRGQDPELTVRLSENVDALRPEALAGARVLRLLPDGSEESAAMVPLLRKEGQKRVLESKIPTLGPGRYAIELSIPDLADRLQGDAGPLRTTFTVIDSEPEAELADLATYWPLLEQLAKNSGGQVYTPETAGDLIERLTQQTETRIRRVERPLYEEWSALVLFLVLVSVEWVGRKLAGLP